MKFNSDIDIDFGDRDAALKLVRHIPASILRDGNLVRHNTGVYVTDVPVDPATGQCALDYQATERRSYIKLDFLNVSVYAQVKTVVGQDDRADSRPLWLKVIRNSDAAGRRGNCAHPHPCFQSDKK